MFTTYFAWGEPPPILPPNGRASGNERAYGGQERPQRSDLPLCKMEITQREGEVAIASLFLPRHSLPHPFVPERGFIFALLEGEFRLLFAGQVTGMPHFLSELWAEITLEAIPQDSLRQLQQLVKSLKKPPFWDPLFVDPLLVDPFLVDQGAYSPWGKEVKIEKNSPRSEEIEQCESPEGPEPRAEGGGGLGHEVVEVLEARAELFYWDRATLELKLSNLFEGRRTMDLSSHVFQGSLKIRAGEPPLNLVRVTVATEWIQEAEGQEDIAPLLARLFPENVLNTYTPLDFWHSWPKPGTKLGRSGYLILDSSLRALHFSGHRPLEDPLGDHATFSPPLKLFDSTQEKPLWIRLQREWYQGTLVLHWRYRQKRREILQFDLRQASQVLGAFQRPKIRELTLRLPPFPPSPRASFFLTDRGRLAALHALEMARAHLAGSARCIEVEAALSFEKGCTLSLDDTVVLSHGTIPGGTLRGKLVEYRLWQEEGTGGCWIRVLVAPGYPAGIHSHPEATAEGVGEEYVEGGYVGTEFVSTGFSGGFSAGFLWTPSGLGYQQYEAKQPLRGVVYPEALRARDLIQELRLQGHPDEQYAHLRRRQYPCQDNWEEALGEVPTRFSLKLQDLRSQEELVHKIQWDLPLPWSAPQQIEFSRNQ